MYELGDIIVAVATAPGEGGVGIVRLSGAGAIAMATRVYSGSRPIPQRRAFLHGTFCDPTNGETLDEGLLLVMPGPHSYTGEDVVEFHTHGSPAVLARLTALLVQLGARPALPGEFTYRAFRNGRLDLPQAEAVQALVSAHGEAARRQALRQLSGGLSVHLEPLEEKLKSLYVQLEARLEFSEDGLPPLDVPAYASAVSDCRETLKKLLDSYTQGRVLRDGLVVALVGAPNVGKSSLLNALLGSDRAIVMPQPGTTRDVVEGEMRLGGQRVRLFDTAGLRASQDPIEEEGVKRSRRVIEEADLVFWRGRKKPKRTRKTPGLVS
jgi:tRNA modification GTPase